MKHNILICLFVGMVCVSAHAEDKAAAPQKISVKGVPSANNTIFKRGKPHAEIHGFVVDQKAGSVGVRVEVSSGPFESDDSSVASMVFSFPQLRYDKETRQIMLGDIVVEKRGVFRWWRNPDYKLTLKSSEGGGKEGIGRPTTITYDVYLVTRDARAKAILAAKGKAGSPPKQ